MLTKSTLIEVTEEIISEAKRCDGNVCMIAEAIKAAVPWAKNVMVDAHFIAFSDLNKGERYEYHTPPVCRGQLILFDQGVQVDPWAFRLPAKPHNTIERTARVRKAKAAGEAPKRASRKLVSGSDKNKSTVRNDAPARLGQLAGGYRGRRRVFGGAVSTAMLRQLKASGALDNL